MKYEKIKDNKLTLILLLALVVVALAWAINEKLEIENKKDSRIADKLDETANKCENLCQQYKINSSDKRPILRYCTLTFQIDMDKDGDTSEKTGAGFNTYCEDGVKCFNFDSCNYKNNSIGIDQCLELIEDERPKNSKKLINEAYELKNKPGKGAGTCNLDDTRGSKGNEVRTWWDIVVDAYPEVGKRD